VSKRDQRFFDELTPFANAIKALPKANLPEPARANKLGDAQRKRERRAARNLANRKVSA